MARSCRFSSRDVNVELNRSPAGRAGVRFCLEAGANRATRRPGEPLRFSAHQALYELSLRSRRLHSHHSARAASSIILTGRRAARLHSSNPAEFLNFLTASRARSRSRSASPRGRRRGKSYRFKIGAMNETVCESRHASQSDGDHVTVKQLKARYPRRFRSMANVFPTEQSSTSSPRRVKENPCWS